MQERTRLQRALVIAHYSNGSNRCACCGESQFEFLAIDHIHGGGKKHLASLHGKGGIVRWIIRNQFPEGFQILCHNCNLAKGFYGICPHELRIAVPVNY